MTALVLTESQVTLVRVLIVAILLMSVAILALVSALGAGTRIHQPVPVLEMRSDEQVDECPRCGGSGTVDLTDDWDRPLVYDAECPRCCGAGVLELWS